MQVAGLAIACLLHHQVGYASFPVPVQLVADMSCDSCDLQLAILSCCACSYIVLFEYTLLV